MTSVLASDSMTNAVLVLEQVTGQKSRDYSTRDFGRENFKGPHSVIVAEDRAERLLWAIRARLPPDVVAFIGTQRSLAEPEVKGTELVVARAKSQFEILRIAASDAINFGKETEDLVRTLQQWDERYGIDVYAAQTDSIQLKLKSLPENVQAFADEVYEFCPDIVDQGIGDVQKLAAEIATTKEVSLWWD